MYSSAFAPSLPVVEKSLLGFSAGGIAGFVAGIMYFVYENNGNMNALSDEVICNNTGTATC